MFKKIWSALTAIPRAICAIVAAIWGSLSAVIMWIWGNLSDFFAAFHSVFRLERLYWSVLYGIIAVGGYTSYAWIKTTLAGLDWALQLSKQVE